MNDLIELYIESLRPKAEALQLALGSLEEGDSESYDSIARIAHQLKGSGASYGFPEITDAAVRVLAVSGELAGPATRSLIELLNGFVSGTVSKNRSVLVVDDDLFIQILLQRILESPGRDVALASTMAEGNRAILESPDIVILDLFLPDGDGRRLLADLRRNTGTANSKVIVLSGIDSDTARNECLELGADVFLQKPFNPASLRTLVDSLLEVQDAGNGFSPVHDVPPVEQPTTNARSVSVLLAEDDDLVAALIVDRLRRDEIDVIHCTDGEAALAEVRTNPPDLAIFDVKMPKMDGFELLGHLRDIPELAVLPVIILTAMGSEHDVVRGFRLGASDYLLKPFSPTELSARVQRLVHAT